MLTQKRLIIQLSEEQMVQKADLRNAGFGAIEIILAVVVVLIVGFVGWRLYDISKNKPTASNQQASGNKSTDRASGDTKVDTAAYLDIKEMGVEIKLDDQVRDATYAMQTLDDGSLVARFSTRSLAASDPACDAKSGQLGALEKSTTDVDRLGNKLVPDGQTVFKFGSYYYTYATSQALCSEAVRSTVGTATAAFREALKTMQLDK